MIFICITTYYIPSLTILLYYYITILYNFSDASWLNTNLLFVLFECLHIIKTLYYAWYFRDFYKSISVNLYQ